jgi:hypothetical protein
MRQPGKWAIAAAGAILLIAFPPSATADDMAYMVTRTNQFGVIDLNTGVFRQLGNISTAGGLGEASDGTLYTADSNGIVYRVNPANGILTTVGTNGVVNYAFCSTTSGLFGLDASLILYSINPSNGVATKIGPTGINPNPGVIVTTGCSAGSSTLYITFGPSYGTVTLYSVNTTTGVATALGTTGADGIGAMVFEDGVLYGGSNWQGTYQVDTIYALNQASGGGSFAASVSGGASQILGLAPIAPPLTPQILSQFAFGAGWYSALYFTNTGSGAASFVVTFTSDNGTPLTVPSIGGSSITVNLAPQATAILEAPNVGQLNQGYATASLPGGVTGYGVFRDSVQGNADQEAVVPLASVSSTTSTLIFDDTSFVTSVAIANPSAVAVTVSITVWDSSGNVIGTSSVPLAPQMKTEKALRDLPGLSAIVGTRGSARFAVSSGSVAVLGLRSNGPALTSIPTLQQ